MWCIDSWAVLDGLAFASRRQPETVDAETTVFLSVPDLEPVPIGRISTALRAQRACFQDGFRNPENGEEFEFENLEQIREVIRRAFLGGGLGPVPAPLEGSPPSPFRSEPQRPPLAPRTQDGGSYYDAALERLGQGENLLRDLSPLSDLKHREELLRTVHSSSELLYPYLEAFAEATMLECLHFYRDQLHLPGPRETITKWSYALRSLGFFDDSFGDQQGLHEIARDIARGYDRRWVSLFDKEILFRIPCPLRASWDRHLQTLGHKLLLPLVDREYFRLNWELPALIPVLFCAMATVETADLSVSRLDELRLADYHRLVGRACQWLNEELPRVELAPEVERQISDFAWNRLTLNPVR